MDYRLSELVRVYDNDLPDELCDEIVRAFERDQGSAFNRHVDGQLSFDELDVDGLTQWLPITVNLTARKDQAFARYQRELGGRFPDEYDHEALRIKRYRPQAKDQFRNHVDGYDRVSALRFMVCFWYLNDVAEGGETVFPHLRLKVSARRGRLIMFPPFWMYEHAGLMPLSNNKYIISTYLRFK